MKLLHHRQSVLLPKYEWPISVGVRIQFLSSDKAMLVVFFQNLSHELGADFNAVLFFNSGFDHLCTVDCLTFFLYTVDGILDGESLLSHFLLSLLRQSKLFRLLSWFSDKVSNQLDGDTEALSNLLLGEIFTHVLINYLFLLWHR